MPEIYYKKKSHEEIFGGDEEYASKFPSRSDKAIPDNFPNMVGAGENADVQSMVVGDIIEVDNWLYMLKTPDGFPDANAHFVEILTPITLEEAMAILKPPLTQDEKDTNLIDSMFTYIWNFHENEYRKRKYFHGFGFGHPVSVSGKYNSPIVNASTYPTNVETIKLSKWRDDCWLEVTSWITEYGNGTLDLITLTSEAYIDENLPKLDPLDPPLSKPEYIKKRFTEIEALAMSIFNTEIKKEKYLFGLGFNKINIDRYESDSDAIALRAWRAELFVSIHHQIDNAINHNMDIYGLDDDLVRELLPDPPDIS